MSKLLNWVKAYLAAHPTVRAFLLTVEVGAASFISTQGYSYVADGSLFTQAGWHRFWIAFGTAEYAVIRGWFTKPPEKS